MLSSMNMKKLVRVKDKINWLQIDILAINELKWIGTGHDSYSCLHPNHWCRIREGWWVSWASSIWGWQSVQIRCVASLRLKCQK